MLAVASIVVSVILYMRSRKEKILVYATRSFNLIHKSAVRITGLSIKYEDNNIDTLTLTKIVFWNKGKATINDIDIAPTDKVRIFPKEDVTILTASIAYKSRDSNNFSLEKIQNAIIVNFDYIDYHQGIIIDLYHTGRDGQSIILKGTVKGGKDLHVSGFSENSLTDKMGEVIFNIIPLPYNNLLRFIMVFLIAIIICIPFIIIAPIYKIYQMMNKLPKEFNLMLNR